MEVIEVDRRIVPAYVWLRDADRMAYWAAQRHPEYTRIVMRGRLASW